MQAHIEFQGTYRYSDPATLERALAAAREALDTRTDDDIDWMRCFTRQGTRLWVRAQLPSEADPLFAAALVETLARTAVEGVVEARRGEEPIDWFPCGME